MWLLNCGCLLVFLMLTGSFTESDEDEAEDSRPSIDFCDLEDEDDEEEVV